MHPREPACVFPVTVTWRLVGNTGPSGSWEPTERPAGHLLGASLWWKFRDAVLSVQSPAPISVCARPGLIGRGRRWAEHKLKIMGHSAPKESEGEEYSGRRGAGRRQRPVSEAGDRSARLAHANEDGPPAGCHRAGHFQDGLITFRVKLGGKIYLDDAG